jgi:hypothetical protein
LLDAIEVLARERIDYAVIGAVTGLRGLEPDAFSRNRS